MNPRYLDSIKLHCLSMALLLTTTGAATPAQVEDRLSPEQTIQRSQHAAEAARRELLRAQHESKLAEQDFVNAQEAARVARRNADELKRQLDAATKARDDAKAREAQARNRYDQALTGVDKAFQKPPAKQ